MATTGGEAEEDVFEHHYTSYSEDQSVTADRVETNGDSDDDDKDLHPLVSSVSLNKSRSRQRTSSALRRRLIRLKSGFHADKRPIADAFIDSNKNRPHYVKEEYSNDLLV